MRFGKQRKKSEQQRKESFVGNFRVLGTEATIKELNKHVVVRHIDTDDGRRILYFADGKIEFKTFNELIMEKVAIIRENDLRRDKPNGF